MVSGLRRWENHVLLLLVTRLSGESFVSDGFERTFRSGVQAALHARYFDLSMNMGMGKFRTNATSIAVALQFLRESVGMQPTSSFASAALGAVLAIFGDRKVLTC